MMDLNKQWEEICERVRNEDWYNAVGMANDLLSDMERSGETPRLTGNPQFDQMAIRALCESISIWEHV